MSNFKLERHVIDLGNVGICIYNFLNQVFRHEPGNENNITFIYQELLAQVLLCITNDVQETHLRLIGLPEMRLFEHLPILSHPDVFEQLVRLTRYAGETLMVTINSECNPMGSIAQYYFDSASLTYLVLMKQIDQSHQDRSL